jgi:O-antigen/teichoic acid export membrane protein
MDAFPELEPEKELPAVGPALESVASLRRRVVRGGTLLIITRAVTQIFVWASTLLIARFLTPLDYGLMSIGLLVVGLADLFAEAGIGRALIQKERLEPRDVDEGFTLNFLLGAVVYVLLFFSAEPLALHVFGAPELPTFLRVLSIHVLLAPFMAIPLALLDRELQMGKQSAIHAGTAVFQSSLVLVLAALGFGYWSFVAGSLARRVVEVASYMAGSGWRPRFAPLSHRVKGLLRFGIHVSLGTFLWYLYSNVDYAFVGNFSGPVILGYYALAFQLTSMPAEKLTANINKIAYPTFCRLQSDRARLDDWFARLLTLVGFIGMPVMVGMALVAEDGVAVVLGDKWLPAVLPLQLLSVAGLVKVYSAMYPMLWTALGRPDLNFKLSLICAIFFPVCYYVAGLWWGMVGVCLVWMIAYPLVILGMVHGTREVTGASLADLARSQGAIFMGTALMATLVLSFEWCTPDLSRLSRLVLSIAVGVLGYAGPMCFFCRQTVLADLWTLWRELKGGTRASTVNPRKLEEPVG